MRTMAGTTGPTNSPTGKSSQRAGKPVTLLGRISGWCFNHRLKAVGLWLVALFMILGAAATVGSRFSTTSTVPDSGSAAGFAVLEEHFPGLGTGGQSGTIVFKARQGVEDPAVKAAMEELFRLVDAGFPGADGVPEHPGGTVVSPYSERGEGQIARHGPLANQIAYAQVNLSAAVDDTASGLLGQAISSHAPALDGLEVLPGGQYLAVLAPPQTELIGLAFAMLVLIVAFGSVLAMGLPIAVALGGVGAGVGITLLLSQLFTIPKDAVLLGMMIGLGVGIDYALFIVSRYRESLHAGRSPREATVAAMD
ncbi:MAG TPA: MMPL family transporter, partial [Acidimicrobiales bacterium]|nr:MMPL family transporter [Acidimicrobiales bacterium]